MKKSRSVKKLGHRRQISKQIIKLNLLNDLYPIPRREEQIKKRSNQRQIASKIRNILDFLEYTQSQEILLELFQQKLQFQLTLIPESIEIIMKGIRVVDQIKNLVIKLTCSNDKKGTQTIFHLKGLISTTYKEVKELVQLFFFYHFLKNHQEDYRTIMRQFERKNILSAVLKVKTNNSEILTSKLLSVLTIIYIKYGEKQKLVKLAQPTLKLRRLVQKNHFGEEYGKVDGEYVSITLYISVKYIEAILYKSSDIFQLMQVISKQIQIVNDYYQNDKIYTNTKDIFINEMTKFKQIASSQLEHDYFHSKYNHQTLENKKQRTKTALKQFKQRKQSFTHSRSGSVLVAESPRSKNSSYFVKSLDNKEKEKEKEKTGERPSYNFREVYNTMNSFKKIQNSSNNNRKTAIKKSKKAAQVEFHSHKTSLYQKNPPEKTSYPNLFMKLSGPTKAEIQKKQEEKKSKIGRIYQAFANENRILRDIPKKNLAKELHEIFSFDIGFKVAVKQMYKKEIVQFSAGLQKGEGNIRSILSAKNCLEFNFLKIWLHTLYICDIKLELGEKYFEVEVTLNGIKNKVLLHRGNNVLCQRYLTIWPTIRYLIQKKIAQLTIFRHYQSDILCRKVAENQLILLSGDAYFQKFGVISKEQIEQVNICLDNLFKIVLVLQHYKRKDQSRYEIGKDYRYKILQLTFQDGFQSKLNMITEIFLNQKEKLTICTFLINQKGKFYQFFVSIARDKLLRIINNKADIEIQLLGYNIERNQMNKKETAIIEWKQLQKNLILFENFVFFIKAFCAKVANTSCFVTRFIKFLTKRIVIKQHPIFPAETCFFQNPKRSFLAEYNQQHCIKNSQILSWFRSFKLNVIENHASLEEIKYQNVEFNEKQLKNQNKSHVGKHGSNRATNEKIKKRKKKDKQVEQWKQQRKINNKHYLVIVTVKFQKNEEFQIQYSFINRLNESKQILKLNHQDFQLIHRAKNIMKQKELDTFEAEALYTLKQYALKEFQPFNPALAIEILNNINFYYNHHVKKIYIDSQNGLFCHCFKNKRKKEIQQVKRLTKVSNSVEKLPFLQAFQFGCKLRITKILKVGNKYAMITFKRNMIKSQTFWQVILQYARNHISYVCQIDEQKLSCILSDYSRKSMNIQKSLVDCQFLSFNSSKSYLSHRSHHQNINVSLDSKHAQYMDYKERILNLFSQKLISVIRHESKLMIKIKEKTFVLKQRVINQWDHQNNIFYSVLIINNKIQVQSQFSKEQSSLLKSSQSQQSQTSMLRSIGEQTIGRIELNYAYRFYEMENKEADEETYYLVRVCQFYLEWCKQQKHKQKYKYNCNA